MTEMAERSRILPIVLLFVGLASAGCESLTYQPEAVGQEGEIIVVIDSVRWEGPVGDAIRGNIAPYLGTLPAPEREFNLRRVSLRTQQHMDMIRMQKNVLVVAPLSDSTSEANFLRSRLDEAAIGSVMEGPGAVISRPNLWRRNQQVMYVLGADASRLINQLEQRGDDIRYAFNDITRRRVEEDMFEKGRQTAMEDSLLVGHGFAVNVQHDYFTAIDTTNFAWLRRVVSSDSWRSLFVFYTEDFDPTNLNPELIYQIRDRLTHSYVQGTSGDWVEIDRRRELNSENIDFKGRFAYETRGLWHLVGENEEIGRYQAGMGGPFVNYTFYDEPSGRLYMIDGMVFAPGHDKREFLRHLEVIAHTFRTQADVDAAQSAAREVAASL